MLRKTTAAVVLAGALALGTASATSLGTFDDVSFAASDANLEACAVSDTATELLDLLPAIPEVGDAVPVDDSSLDPDVAGNMLPSDGGTLLLESLDLTELVNALPDTCTGDLADLVIIGDPGTGEQVLTTIEAIDITESVTSVNITNAVDILHASKFRLVVRNDASTS